MDERRQRRTGAARMLAVLAVLVGMFLMHGAPTSATGDCHDAASATLPAVQPMSVQPMAATPVLSKSVAGSTVLVPRASASGMGAMNGLCLSTGTRDHLDVSPASLVALALVVVFAALLEAGVLGPFMRARRGGPPGAGRQILLRVCIART
ncbi:hypothetical protein [Streptacidiphilus cavernicola]|uniref:Uncharacterized protein n=1 Tax=Streptacidiphilus cavernicola TaxID=3342716 RepID=A0ABV6VQB4_9ACTN